MLIKSESLREGGVELDYQVFVLVFLKPPRVSHEQPHLRTSALKYSRQQGLARWPDLQTSCVTDSFLLLLIPHKWLPVVLKLQRAAESHASRGLTAEEEIFLIC